jgi:hypothetical protein
MITSIKHAYRVFYFRDKGKTFSNPSLVTYGMMPDVPAS